jgi:hypothetical protein
LARNESSDLLERTLILHRNSFVSFSAVI